MATRCVARELIALGHDVKQVPPVYAKPFRQRHKNDFRDAHAIAEAVQHTAGPYSWVIFDQGCGLCRAAHFRFTPKADVTSHRNMIGVGLKPPRMGV